MTSLNIFWKPVKKIFITYDKLGYKHLNVYFRKEKSFFVARDLENGLPKGDPDRYYFDEYSPEILDRVAEQVRHMHGSRTFVHPLEAGNVNTRWWPPYSILPTDAIEVKHVKGALRVLASDLNPYI